MEVRRAPADHIGAKLERRPGDPGSVAGERVLHDFLVPFGGEQRRKRATGHRLLQGQVEVAVQVQALPNSLCANVGLPHGPAVF